ncbi:MAG: lipopolysaccharide heptosyltransferase I [Nevskiaceae bacterium]|nr:MAG: lipopolysaccharide heptosyltransferase I [Nevskiaceae bacterium]TBR72624.1 MAG: lipopolysaccharide heptosyltransferase I [Nevskiaceae bacterium]
MYRHGRGYECRAGPPRGIPLDIPIVHVLLVKTSSLGDLIHTLPAVTDAVAACPGLTFDWVAERPFVEIPAWHPAVRQVFASDLRNWRHHPFARATREARAQFRAALQGTHHDFALDAQGLLKSAWIARQAGVPIAGPDWNSAREGLASRFYARRYPVPSRLTTHAIERLRRLFAQVFEYPLPVTAPDAGLDRGRFPVPGWPRPYVLLLHATSWATKRWPDAHWMRLAQWLDEHGFDALLPWGGAAERETAERIADDGHAHVLPRQSLTELGGWLAHARAFVGVDTGLSHLGAALATPGVTLYGPTLPHLTGALGGYQIQLADPIAQTVDRNRRMDISVARATDALERLLRDTP